MILFCYNSLLVNWRRFISHSYIIINKHKPLSAWTCLLFSSLSEGGGSWDLPCSVVWYYNFFGCMLPPTPLARSFGELAFGELGTDSLVQLSGPPQLTSTGIFFFNREDISRWYECCCIILC